jgi:hypothetical protein
MPAISSALSASEAEANSKNAERIIFFIADARVALGLEHVNVIADA